MIEKRGQILYRLNIMYLILGIIIYSASSFREIYGINNGILINQMIILIPNLLYIYIKKLNFKEELLLNKISFSQLVHCLALPIFVYPVAAFLNLNIIMLTMVFGNHQLKGIAIPASNKEYLLSILYMCILPGITEEIMFRGNLKNGYKYFGHIRAITYTAILFAMYHFSIQNLLGPIYIGIVLGSVVYKTKSIYASMIVHILNNLIVMTLGYKSNLYDEYLTGVMTSSGHDFPRLFLGYIVLGLIAFASALVVDFIVKNMPMTGRYEYWRKKSLLNRKFMVPVVFFTVFYLIINIKMFFIG